VVVMARHTRPTVTQSRAVLRQLEETASSLSDFLDPGNEMCSVPSEAREGMAGLYLHSWVQSPLLDAIKRLECALDGRPYTHFQDDGDGESEASP
jgi:hypothetical protein